MQDGAPPHFSRAVRGFLDEAFPLWIGRRGTVDWPPRSPDLTPCDFSMWGIIKQRVYSVNPQTLAALREQIVVEFDSLNANKELCRSICHSVIQRFYACIQVQAEHFEHLV